MSVLFCAKKGIEYFRVITNMVIALQRYTGWIILAFLLTFLASKLFHSVIFLAAIMAWAVFFCEWKRIAKGSRRLASSLLLAGSCMVFYSAAHGVFLGWEKILTLNLPILSMFVAVSFLAMTNPLHQDESLPTGKRAIATTALGTNILGAVINLSVLIVYGDRLKRNNALTKVQAILLARSFCAAAWWSPFFIAAGVVLTYAPEMNYTRVLLPGLIMCGFGICYTIVEVGFFRKTEFTGYPVKKESFLVPILLTLAIICGHHLLPEMSIILLICLFSPPMAIILMTRRPRIKGLQDFVTNRITSTVSQFVLFLAAGVFSVGIHSLIQVYPELFNFTGESFSHLQFALVLAALIILGLVGVHPLICISIASPLLLPLHPDHSELAFMFLTCWAIITGCSPLSGVGLLLSGRYHIAPKTILMSNFHYVVTMWLLAILIDVVYFN